MTRTLRLLLLPLMVCLASLFQATPAFAFPPLPSSFYGTVKVNGQNVADGTVVKAIINGQTYAEGVTQTYQGNSVYSLDVKGDDSSTAAIDGAREGDTVQFTIGGVGAAQTGTWHSGTNMTLNLTATTAASTTLPTPRATHTPLPTQTQMVVQMQPSATPTKTPAPTVKVEAAVSLAVETLDTALPTEAGNAGPITPEVNPGLASPASGINENVLRAGAIVLVLLAGGALYFILRRK